ncbi:kinase-like protein [Apiospora arundinis]
MDSDKEKKESDVQITQRTVNELQLVQYDNKSYGIGSLERGHRGSMHRDHERRVDPYQNESNRTRFRDDGYQEERLTRDRRRGRRDRSREWRWAIDQDDLCHNCWHAFNQRRSREINDTRRARAELIATPSRDGSRSPPGAELDPEGRMYQYIMDEELEHETKERYRPGGFHPIMPGDNIGHQNRYEVVDKLGWGHRSTVWLCKDLEVDSWKAIKVLQAVDSTGENKELQIFRTLEHVDREELEKNHIGLPESYFWQEGPNGRHLCFVSKLVASMHSIPPAGYGAHSPTLLVDLCFQLATAVKYLHDKGLCHGDIRTENIAMRLDDTVDKLSRQEMDQYLGKPEVISEVMRLSGRPAYPHAPDCMMKSASTRKLESNFRTGQVILIDFGLHYETSKTPPRQISYRSNAAPEMLFKDSPSGPATDLWALACVMVELRTRNSLISEEESWSRILRKMEWRWGPLPDIYKDDVSRLLEIEDYSVDEMREAPWKPGDPLAIPMSRDVYQRTKSGPSHKMWTIKDHLSRARQTFKYDLTEDTVVKLGQQFSFYDGTSDEYSSSDDGISSKTNKKRRALGSPTNSVEVTKRRSADSLKSLSSQPTPRSPTQATEDIKREGKDSDEDTTVPETGVKADIQRAISRGRTYKRGDFPDSSNPCICDWDETCGGRRICINRSCTAKQHWAGDPEQIVMWQMSKNEQNVFGDLLDGLFKYDPRERLTTDQVINHRWFKNRREIPKE